MWTFTKRLRADLPPAGNPLPPLLDLGAARRVLVVAPHPDDETMGCGGTVARLAPHVPVQVVLVTNGDGAGGLPEGASDVRKAEMRAAMQRLGVTTPLITLDEPDGHFNDSPAFRRRLGEIVESFQPNWVFLPWLLDSHADHWRISRASAEVISRSGVDQVLFYETWTPVPATHVVDITDTAQAKREALECHVTALAHGNYVDATFGLNAYRALYVPGRLAKFAETFAVRAARDCLRA